MPFIYVIVKSQNSIFFCIPAKSVLDLIGERESSIKFDLLRDSQIRCVKYPGRLFNRAGLLPEAIRSEFTSFSTSVWQVEVVELVEFCGKEQWSGTVMI